MTRHTRPIPVAPGQMTMDALFIVLLPQRDRSLTLLAGGRRDTPEPEPAAPVVALRSRRAA